MALPPDTSDSFVREVDENLRRDQMADRAKRYGALVVGGIVLFLVAVAGYLFWQNREQKRAEAATEQLTITLQDIGANQTAAAPGQLDTLRQSDADGVRATAGLTRAALALQQGNRKLASTVYAEIAADTSLPRPYRDLALVRGTALEFDALKPDEVIVRLQPLAEPGQPFFGSAGEMVGMALIAKGQKPAAAQLFAKIAADNGVPDSLRSRAVQVAGSLGLDASASLPTGATTAE
ncbi:MAG: tetratricopeptide repeat protein [Pseudomonadota bacterium]|nr:tetratricopeptide repeat protein [Pseudomonadota bacterium]